MTAEWQVGGEVETVREFGEQLVRQLRGGSGGGGGGFSGGGGSWGGGSSYSGGSRGNSYYYGSSSTSSGGGTPPVGIIIVVGVIVLFGILICCLKGEAGKIGSDPGFDAAVNEERDRGQATFTAIAHKSTHQMLCGIGMKIQNGSLTITSIDPDGLFANSGLKVGMIVKTINNMPVAGKTAAEATQLIKDAVGQVTIVVAGGQSSSSYESVTGGPNPPFETLSGTFDMSYTDRGKQFRGHVCLELKNNERDGYIVTGTTSDADGSATIIEGLVTYEGDAWWVDEVFSGNDIGLKVLSTGKFDWLTNNFQGGWRANTGRTGQYSTFQCTNASKTFASIAPAAGATPPIVAAVVATPVSYSQTPIVTAVAESSSPVVVAVGNKPTKDTSVGIGIKAPNGTPVISSIQPDGLFATSALRVGMDIQSINKQSVSGKTAAEATQLIKDAVGEITIIAGWNLSVSPLFTAVPMASAPPAEPEVYVPSY